MIPSYKGELQFFFLAGPFLRLGQGVRSLRETKYIMKRRSILRLRIRKFIRFIKVGFEVFFS